MFPMLSAGVMSSIFFGVNGNVMWLIQDYRSRGTINNNINVRYCCDAENMNKYWHYDVFLSACIGGFSFMTINIPLEVIKTMLQASSNNYNFSYIYLIFY